MALYARRVMAEMITKELNHLLRSLIRIESIQQLPAAQHRQTKSIKTDAFNKLLKVVFDPSLFGVRQVWFGLEEHDEKIPGAFNGGRGQHLPGDITRFAAAKQRRFRPSIRPHRCVDAHSLPSERASRLVGQCTACRPWSTLPARFARWGPPHSEGRKVVNRVPKCHRTNGKSLDYEKHPPATVDKPDHP